MGKASKQKWQEEIEAILREQCQGKELSKQRKITEELIDLAREVEVPSGDSGQAIAQIMKTAGEELPPLAGVYIGFQLGVAWERFQNAKRAR